MLTAVLSGFGIAWFAPLLHRLLPKYVGWVLALLPLSLTLFFASLLVPVSQGEVLLFSYPWAPSLGLVLSFRIDGLSLLFALLVCGIGTLVLIYAGGYMAGDPNAGRLLLFLILFMASMIGLVTADNLIALFIFWELTTVTSYMLIGYKHAYEKARKAALQGMLVTGGGGLAMLAGFVLLAQAGGSYELSTLLTQGDTLRAHPLYPAILTLVLAGAFTKSAQFPFHFWLPGAMEAPTPVSSYLHSATMVKAGVYLLARLNPALGGTEAWQLALTLFGGATMVAGAFLAVQQTDLKRILAYTTVSALGTLVTLIGIGTDDALKAAMVFVLSHALYKGALFMAAGSVDHEAGTRDITQLGGLRAAMPITAAASGLAAISMAGLPPMIGFVAKEVLYKAKLEEPFLIGVALVANILMVVAAGVVFVRVFFGKVGHPPKHPHEAPISMWIGPVVLAFSGLLVGLFATPIGDVLIGPAASAVIGQTKAVELLLWAGIEGAAGQALALSVLTVAVGVGLFLRSAQLLALGQRLAPLYAWGPERWYTLTVDGMLVVARRLTAILQNGYLRSYLLMALLTLVLLGGYALIGEATPGLPVQWLPLTLHEVLIAAVMLVAVWVMIRTDSRMTAIIGLSVVGTGSSLFFLLYSAPDLAMTQFAVETLSVVLFVLIVYRLPRFLPLSSRITRLRDTIVALTSGVLVSLLMLTTLSLPHEQSVTPYYAETSLTEARGRNVVNVILVDFRALDTLGEIVVLGLAALGVFALLRLRPRTEMPLLPDTKKQKHTNALGHSSNGNPVADAADPDLRGVPADPRP